MADIQFTHAKLSQDVFDKANKDENFRKLLADSPHEAVKQLGVDIPKSVKIKVIDKEDNVVYLVRPVHPQKLNAQDNCPLLCVVGGCPSGYQRQL